MIPQPTVSVNAEPPKQKWQHRFVLKCGAVFDLVNEDTKNTHSSSLGSVVTYEGENEKGWPTTVHVDAREIAAVISSPFGTYLHQTK